MPVVGAANATAVAGGFELLLGCDVIVASSEAAVRPARGASAGLFPGGGGTSIGTRIPLGVALEMTLTGDPINAARAHEIGLVNAVVAPDEVLATALALPSGSPPTARSAVAATKELVRLAVTDPARAAERLRRAGSASCSPARTPRRARRPSSRSAPPVWQGRELTCAPRVCRAYGPPEVVAVDELPSPAARRRPGAGPGRRRGGQLPRRAARRQPVPDQVPPPFVPGSEFAGVVAEVGDGRRRPRGRRPGDRHRARRRLRRGGGRRRAAALTPHPGRGRRPRHAAAFGVAHRTAYHVLRSVARVQPGEELVVLGAGGGVGLAAVQLGALLGAVGHRGGVVAREAGGRGRRYGATQPHRPPGRRPAPGAARRACPAAPTSWSTPSAATWPSRRCASLRWGGRFVTVGYASGAIPRIPLNLVLLKGVQILGFQFLRLRDPRRRTSSAATRTSCRAARRRARAPPHIGATFPLDEAAAALRYVADGRAIGKVVLDVSRREESS